MIEALVKIVKNLYHYRYIFSWMVIKKIKGRFKGSIDGFFYHFIHPILKIVIFLFVFVYIFKLKVGAGYVIEASAIYLIARLFPQIILVGNR